MYKARLLGVVPMSVWTIARTFPTLLCGCGVGRGPVTNRTVWRWKYVPALPPRGFTNWHTDLLLFQTFLPSWMPGENVEFPTEPQRQWINEPCLDIMGIWETCWINSSVLQNGWTIQSPTWVIIRGCVRKAHSKISCFYRTFGCQESALPNQWYMLRYSSFLIFVFLSSRTNRQIIIP